jgi:S1-C subfamily serine protease
MQAVSHRRIGGFLAALGLLVVVGVLLAQEQPAERDRQREPAAREGGIPRRGLADRDQDPEEGMEEGVPSAEAAPRLKEFAPRFVPPRGEWRLGVWAYNTDTGVVITRVVPGSAAERQGLERGDRIVAVGGYQVGYVGDLLYPLGYELQRQAGRRGKVLLLVQNVRNDELLSMEVQLDGGSRPRPLPRPLEQE